MADDKPTNNESWLAYCMGLVDDGLMRRRPYDGTVWENIATYAGDLWSEYDPHRRTLRDPIKKRKSWKSRIPVNLAQPVVRTELAKLVKNRPILDVMPASDEREDLNSAKVADQILNMYVEREFHMPRVRRRALHWTLVAGFGGIFVDFDHSAESAIEVYMDPRGNPIEGDEKLQAWGKYFKRRNEQMPKSTIERGELRIMPLSPLQLIYDFSKNYFEDAAWCIVSEVYDCDEVERRWGKRPESERGALPNVLERRMLSKMDLTSRKNQLTLEDPKTQDLCQVHRLFVKPGQVKWFPRGAEMVFTSNEMLEKENFPHGHGELPVATMGHVPNATSQYAMSVLQQVRPIVLEISKTESQLVDNRNLMANPPWLIPQQSRVENEIQARPGMRLRYRHTPNVPEPHPIQMPEIPQYVKDLVPMMKDHVLEISGQGETSQGRVPPGARSGVAIAYLQEEDDTRLGPTVSEYEEMMERTGFLTLETIAQNYEITRTIRLYRKHGDPEVFDFVGSMIEGNTHVVCQAGSALPRSKAAKQQFILDLWDRKLEQDPRKVREMLELSGGEPDEWEIDINQADRENRRMEEGEQVTVEEWHNHAAHQFKHREFMKTADWDGMGENIKQMYRDHDNEHGRFLAQQQQEMAQMDPNQNGGQPAANGMPVPGPADQFQPSESLLDAGPQ